jgi:hypothetical protein
MQSNVPGIIAQMKGTPTRHRHTIITISVESSSDVTYIHPQQTSSSIDTLKAKHAFERWSASYERKIKHYHILITVVLLITIGQVIVISSNKLYPCMVSTHIIKMESWNVVLDSYKICHEQLYCTHQQCGWMPLIHIYGHMQCKRHVTI